MALSREAPVNHGIPPRRILCWENWRRWHLRGITVYCTRVKPNARLALFSLSIFFFDLTELYCFILLCFFFTIVSLSSFLYFTESGHFHFVDLQYPRFNDRKACRKMSALSAITLAPLSELSSQGYRNGWR